MYNGKLYVITIILEQGEAFCQYNIDRNTHIFGIVKIRASAASHLPDP